MTKFDFENNRLLDVVNEKDEIIGSRSRIDIHRLGLLHRDIHVWMFDEKHDIFFQKRGLDRFMAGLLDATVGGHLNKGEDYMEAAIRETKEETGISISSSDLILLKKIKIVSNPESEDFLDVINNCMRNVYIYKHPIKKEQLKKEPGIIGVDFKKFSPSFIMNLDKEQMNMFDVPLLTNEIPL